MATIEQTAFGLSESERVEFGDLTPKRTGAAVSKFVIASYNIRYAVGRFLISGGLMRKAGLRGSRQRENNVRRNIGLASRAFTEGKLLPRVDVLALQEAASDLKQRPVK